MHKLVNEISELENHIREVQQELRNKKVELIKKIIDEGMFELLTVNINRIKREYR